MGLVPSCTVATDRPKDDDFGGRKNRNLNLINQQFESIQPDGLVPCDRSSPNGLLMKANPFGARRQSCSAKMKRGGLRSTWRSCRSCCSAFKVVTARNEARRIAANIAKLPNLIRKA